MMDMAWSHRRGGPASGPGQTLYKKNSVAGQPLEVPPGPGFFPHVFKQTSKH
jgi:hypothetical protein